MLSGPAECALILNPKALFQEDIKKSYLPSSLKFIQQLEKTLSKVGVRPCSPPPPLIVGNPSGNLAGDTSSHSKKFIIYLKSLKALICDVMGSIQQGPGNGRVSRELYSEANWLSGTTMSL